MILGRLRSIVWAHAEGCGRSGDRELIRFLHISPDSASELEFQLQLAADLGFLAPNDRVPLPGSVVERKRMLATLIRALRKSSNADRQSD